MVLLDKSRAALWIKIGAAALATIFALSFVPMFRSGEAGTFFKSLFTAKSQPSDKQELAKLKNDIQKNPKNTKTLIDLANYYYDHQDAEKAITYYTKALEITPDNQDVRVDRGASYFAIRDYDKALEDFRTVTDANPNHPQAWYNMGLVFKNKNDVPNQRFAWERFLAVQPNGEQSDQVRQELANLKQ